MGLLHNMRDLKEVDINFMDVFNLLFQLNYKLQDSDLPQKFPKLMKYFLLENYNQRVIKKYIESENQTKYYRQIVKFFELFLKE